MIFRCSDPSIYYAGNDFPVTLEGWKSWALEKQDRKTVDAFEL